MNFILRFRELEVPAVPRSWIVTLLALTCWLPVLAILGFASLAGGTI
ncbi:hypothetical protein [Devosia chinhatensis]|nr:hypothetical protein [Devosia chinhatensis]